VHAEVAGDRPVPDRHAAALDEASSRGIHEKLQSARNVHDDYLFSSKSRKRLTTAIRGAAGVL
jgi:hypothetical protein